MKRLCPDEERLGDYIEGRLNNNDRSRIEEHLADCENCRQEFIIGKGLVRGSESLELDPVPKEVTQSALRLVKGRASVSASLLMEKCSRFFNEMYSMLVDFFRPVLWGKWGLANIRGSRKVVSEDLVHFRRRFRDIEAEIEIERAGKGRAHIRVRLASDNGDDDGIRVTLKRGEREISSNLPDNRGHVLFEDMPFDHYTLHFTRDKKTLGDYHFEIKET